MSAPRRLPHRTGQPLIDAESWSMARARSLSSDGWRREPMTDSFFDIDSRRKYLRNECWAKPSGLIQTASCSYASHSLQETPARDIASVMDFIETNQYFTLGTAATPAHWTGISTHCTRPLPKSQSRSRSTAIARRNAEKAMSAELRSSGLMTTGSGRGLRRERYLFLLPRLPHFRG